MNTAMRIRQRKEKRPELYCSNKACLWNVASSGPCRKHGPKPNDAPENAALEDMPIYEVPGMSWIELNVLLRAE